MVRRPAATSPAWLLPGCARVEEAHGVSIHSRRVTGTDHQEYVLHPAKSLKLLAASALAVAALGTPLAQAATDLPPGPGIHATDLPPGPNAQAAIIAI